MLNILLVQLSSRSTNQEELYSYIHPASLSVCQSVIWSVSQFVHISMMLSGWLMQTCNKSEKTHIIHTIYWQSAGKVLQLKLPFTFIVPGDWVFSLVFKSARAGRVLGMKKQLLALMTLESIILTGNQILR